MKKKKITGLPDKVKLLIRDRKHQRELILAVIYVVGGEGCSTFKTLAVETT